MNSTFSYRQTVDFASGEFEPGMVKTLTFLQTRNAANRSANSIPQFLRDRVKVHEAPVLTISCSCRKQSDSASFKKTRNLSGI